MLAGSRSATATPSTTIPEEQRCNYAFYQEMLAFEVSSGLAKSKADCVSYLDHLKRLQFGPPSQWEIFNMMCKTACRSYYDRWFRIISQTDCDCTLFNPPSCPASPTDLLCLVTQFCYPWDAYYSNYCAPDACGRQANNEDSWRHCKEHPFKQ